MMRGMFAAISGLKQHQVMLDVTANDIANVNTIGYKSSRVTFQDSLTQMQRGAAGPTATTRGSNAAQVGLGVGLGSVDNLMTGGAAQTTGNPLDVAIQGDGFFQVGSGTPSGAGRGARADRLHARGQLLDQLRRLPDDARRASTCSAIAPPQPAAASPTSEVAIKIPAGASGVAIDQSTAASPTWTRRRNTRVTPYRLTLATFPNASGLQRAGGNSWIASANSGDADRNTPGTGGAGDTTAGAVEMSNVDLAQTFTNMIIAQRGFQANSRVISTADEMLRGPRQPQALIASPGRSARRHHGKARRRRAFRA